MLTPLTAGLVVAGLLLAFVGAAVSVYAVALTGVLVGAGAGYLAAPNLAGLIAVDGLVLTGAAVAVGAAVGGFLAYAGLSFAVVAIGGLVGGFAGRFAVGPMYAADAAGIEGTLLLVGATLAGVAVGALFGFVLSRRRSSSRRPSSARRSRRGRSRPQRWTRPPRKRRSNRCCST